MYGKEKASELLYKFARIEGININKSKECSLTAVNRNIEMFLELVNRMDDFSNESRQVIYQLIENEQEVKQELENL